MAATGATTATGAPVPMLATGTATGAATGESAEEEEEDFLEDFLDVFFESFLFCECCHLPALALALSNNARSRMEILEDRMI